MRENRGRNDEFENPIVDPKSGGGFKGSLGRAVPPRPSNPDPV